MKTQSIKGGTRLIGLLGNPVVHSLSPQIQNHALKSLDLPYTYVPLAVQVDKLGEAVSALKIFKFIGANITIPFKKDILNFCDSISELSELTGTVNTITINNGMVHGTTTDAKGFFKALSLMGHNFKKDNVVILGNGGTARTLGFALIKQGSIQNLSFIGRDRERVRNLAKEIIHKTGCSITWTTFNTPESKRILATCTLLVNCTSVGMAPHINESPVSKEVLHENMMVFDAIYNPAETLLLRQAKECGCRTQNGLFMLLFQGLASLAIWTGKEADPKIFNMDELQAMIP